MRREYDRGDKEDYEEGGYGGGGVCKFRGRCEQVYIKLK